MSQHIHCLIVGSGPAGYTAAIYAARADLKPVLYTGMVPGGQLTQTTDVENFPGYPDGIMGPAMMQDLHKQAERFGTQIRFSQINKVEFSTDGGVHKLWADNGDELTADSVIISTGATAKWLGLPSEQKYNGQGVSACAVCDGFFYRGKEVAIVGGGDTACEEALYLSKLCTTVHMLVRRDVLRASTIMQQRVIATPNIKMYWDSETDEILGDVSGVTGLRIRNIKTGSTQEIAIHGFFVAIGHQPNTAIFQGQLRMDETGYLITDSDSTHTNLAGIFAAGDVQDKNYRQAVTAAGTGCMAALDAERYLAAK